MIVKYATVRSTIARIIIPRGIIKTIPAHSIDMTIIESTFLMLLQKKKEKKNDKLSYRIYLRTNRNYYSNKLANFRIVMVVTIAFLKYMRFLFFFIQKRIDARVSQKVRR